MKNIKFYTLLVLMLMMGGVTMQAQEQLEVELIGEGNGYLAMLSLGEDEFLPCVAKKTVLWPCAA